MAAQKEERGTRTQHRRQAALALVAFLILSGLDAKCLMCCAMTCRYIYDVVENSPNLRLIIESHFTGFEVSGNTSSTQSFPDNILRTFERCRRAWTSPRWDKSLSLHLENLNMIYFYRSGTLCGQEGNYTEITPLRADSPFSNIATGKTIKRTFQRQFTFREGHNWVDPSQDLLVLVSDNEVPVSFNETRIIRIHLRTLSTDDLHPRAMQPFLRLIVPPNEESNEIHGARVQIARNVLMIHFNTVPQPWNFDKKMRVVIWDWTTSDLVLDSASSTI
ncbi:hypothetical protein BDN70DRAFT_412829 [Pholiota conissans]|uniref:Uncharacterized protein n=1 Tax=Pholiota conissans TaxID=109636 RepID=A0A9P5YQ96_9AGAR|nr:hypothetical protein BDN70DRAFT_412829 [Pholiota conissans]